LGEPLVQSWYRDGDQDEARRVLEIVAGALAIIATFWRVPTRLSGWLSFPVAAGYGSIDLRGDCAAAQPCRLMRLIAHVGVIREQADVIRASFELNVARAVASQWWGQDVVGSRR
jgi:hypothetical protein